MSTYSTNDLLERPADILAEATRGPVTLTLEDEPQLVLLSIDEFRELRARASRRVAHRTEDMSDELFEEVRKAIDAYEREED